MHGSAPKVSVIIPTKNRFALASEAVQSVLTQTYKNFEIIIVDDSDEEQHRRLKDGFKNHPAVKILRGDGINQTSARIRGIRVSHGEYIAFLDSDDLWYPSKLAAHMEVWQRISGIGLTWDNWELRDKDSTTIVSPPSYLQPDAKMRGLLFARTVYNGNFVTMSCAVVRRDCYEHVGGFRVQENGIEDLGLWLRIAAKYDVYNVSKVLTVRRLQLDSTTKVQRAESIKAFRKLQLKMAVTRPRTFGWVGVKKVINICIRVLKTGHLS